MNPCGCKVAINIEFNQANPQIAFCNLHESAEKLLEGAKEALARMGLDNDHGIRCDVKPCWAHELWTTIAKATQPK